MGPPEPSLAISPLEYLTAQAAGGQLSGSALPAGRAASGAFSGSSSEAGLPPPEFLAASRGASLCDDYASEQEELLTRELTQEILRELNGQCSGSGAGAGGGAQLLDAAGTAQHTPGQASTAAADASMAPGAGAYEQQLSLYEQVGGGVVVKLLVDEFYRRVLGDPRLAPFFADVNMAKHARKFLLFTTYVLGGPDEYLQLHPEPWPQLYYAHERLIRHSGLQEGHFDLVKAHFRAALEAVGAGQTQIGQALNIVESTRRVIFPVQTPPQAPAAPAVRCPYSGTLSPPKP